MSKQTKPVEPRPDYFRALPRLPYTAQFPYCVLDSMGNRYGADSWIEATVLARMLNMLTPDQRQAASVEAVKRWKDQSNGT